MSTDRTWTATPEQSPREKLRALLRHVAIETPTAEIARLAFIHIPGAGDPSTVESVQETLADEHALARAERWLTTQDEPPTITLADERRTIPPDTEGDVHPAEVRAIVAHRLSARAARTCENPGGVIDCAGPDCIGYTCPECSQQRRREDAIIDELLLTVKRAQMDESRLLAAPAERDADANEAANTGSETASSGDHNTVEQSTNHTPTSSTEA